MPSPASDLAVYTNGGTQITSSLRFKEDLPGWKNSRPASAQSGSPTGSDFDAMLDAPAGAAKLSLGKLGRGKAAAAQAAADSRRSMLDPERAAAATSTLQIKGMRTGAGKAEAGPKRTARPSGPKTTAADLDLSPGATGAAGVDPASPLTQKTVNLSGLPDQALPGPTETVAVATVVGAVLNGLATDESKSADAAQPGLPENSNAPQITPEIRRDVVEAVAAMLAPFLMSLPTVVPGTLGGTPGIGEKDAMGTAVTIKFGSQPAITFDLSNPATGTDAGAKTGPEADGCATSDLLSALPGNLTPDFRIQLKTTIESAWQQAEHANANFAASSLENLTAASAVAARQGLSDIPLVGGQVTPGVAPEIPSSMATVGLASPFTAQPVGLSERAGKDESAIAPVEVMIEVPGFGSVTARILSSNSAGTPSGGKSGNRNGQAEKNAAGTGFAGMAAGMENAGSEKTFLSGGVEALKSKVKIAGTDVAHSGDSMPATFTSRRVTVDQLEFPPRITGRDVLPALSASQDFAATAGSTVASTPAPVLAHRAVETILNVVEAQRSGSANASSVNLHFKFGGDDLAVRVQMRGGEVLTQFLTDSADLRRAITSEWQKMAGQGGVAGLRLLEPVVTPAGAGGSTGFGSDSQGQNHAQQNARQQQAQAAEAMPELRAMRRGASFAAPIPESASGSSVAQPTSRLLTAIA